MLTSDGDSQAAPSPLADHAEEVRAWFVHVRGGAPFLSAADGDALVGWLEAGVPVSRILRAVERVAERRRARRTRKPFTLRSIGAELRRADPQTPAVAALAMGGADDVLAQIRAVEGDAEARARAGCVLARAYIESQWAAERDVVLAAVREEMAAMRDGVGEEAFAALCEEVGRDRIRSRWPQLTATAIWQELTLGVG